MAAFDATIAAGKAKLEGKPPKPLKVGKKYVVKGVNDNVYIRPITHEALKKKALKNPRLHVVFYGDKCES